MSEVTELVTSIRGYVSRALVGIRSDIATATARLETHAFRLHMLEKDGTQGPPGPPGEIGPMPAHRWSGTRLQFEQAPGGEWGESVDLKGDRGDPGRRGRGAAVTAAATTNSWSPRW